MPSVLITGGAGYLGSAVTAAFMLTGFKVTVVDNFTHGVPSLSSLLSLAKLTLVHGDVRNTTLIHSYLKNADVIVPLAALVGAPVCEANEQLATEVNYEAVAWIVKNSSMSQTVIYPNTNSGYGVGGEDLCTEETPLSPISHYGRTKQLAEERVLSHGNGISLRFATLFGPSARMRMDLMVNDFVYRAVTDRSIVLFEGGFRRNFLHVRDAAFLFPYIAGLGGRYRGQAFNAGLTAANMTKRELCERIKEQVPGLHVIEVPLGKDPDKRDYLVSNAKLEASGWAPQFSLAEGISSLIQCYRQPFAGRQWRNY